MSDKLPKNFDHERAGTELKDNPCSRCHEDPCKCDSGERL